MGIEDFLREELRKKELEEEAAFLSGSFVDFVKAAWPCVKPDTDYLHNWHIDVVCDHLEAVSCGEIRRLQIWLPPISMKTWLVSVFWPAWEWTTRPSLKYFTASYETRFSGRLAALSRDLMMTTWYRERWGNVFAFVRDAEHLFSNDRGGTRLATSPDSTGTGEHGDRIIIDDPINAADTEATSGMGLQRVNGWYDGTIGTRGLPGQARVLVMQRLHENDLAGHLVAKGNWEVLCLPERYEWNHPFVWSGDKRKDGDLLWPAFRGEEESNEMAADLKHRAAGQLQQRPAAREGEILKRHWWRFYDPKLFQNEVLKDRRPKFSSIVQTGDFPGKDKESNDLVAIQAWGVVGADRYLLDLKKGHMNYGQAKRAVLEQARYVRRLYPHSAHYCLIENAGYGVDLILELKRDITGIQKIPVGQDGDKEIRATRAADALESGNCWLPGYREGNDEFSMPDEARLSSDIADFIDSCATFPNATYDDDVDAWSQCMNWLRSRSVQKLRTSSPFRRRRDATRAS